MARRQWHEAISFHFMYTYAIEPFSTEFWRSISLYIVQYLFIVQSPFIIQYLYIILSLFTIQFTLQVLEQVHLDCASVGAVNPIYHVVNTKSELEQYESTEGRPPFPLMCKSLSACGSAESHDMGLIYNKNGNQEPSI